MFFVPAWLNMTGSLCTITGLILVAPSIYQMIRGSTMIIVTFYSVIFFKKKLFRHQWVGIMIAICGVMTIGIVSVLHKASSAKDPLLGIALLMIGQLFVGGMMVMDEITLRYVKIHPLEVVGVEGVGAVAFFAVILPAFNLIPCEIPNLCFGGNIENVVLAVDGMLSNLTLLFSAMMFSITIAFYYWGCLTVTKHESAIARSVVDPCRAIFIWFFSIYMGWEVFDTLQFTGFIIQVSGSMIFNELLIPPFFGLDASVLMKRASSSIE